MTTTPPRIFNEIIDLGEYYLKLSKDVEKITSEIEFYKTLPKSLRNYYPEVDVELKHIGDRVGYTIKKIPTPDASYYFVAEEKNKIEYFEKLIASTEEYLKKCPTRLVDISESNVNLTNEIIKKDLSRLSLIKQLAEYPQFLKIIRKFGFDDLDHYLATIHNDLMALHGKVNLHYLAFSHGDLCLSNILQYKDQLYLIDPKGCLPGGDNLRSPYYDYAKLAQCFYGNYDYINLLKFNIEDELLVTPNAENLQVKNLFHKFCVRNNINEEYLKLMQATFFFSMIPLHLESFDKMHAFLLSSIRSWRTYSYV